MLEPVYALMLEPADELSWETTRRMLVEPYPSPEALGFFPTDQRGQSNQDRYRGRPPADHGRDDVQRNMCTPHRGAEPR